MQEKLKRFQPISIGLLACALLCPSISGCNGSVEQPGPCDLTYDLLQYLRVDGVSNPTPVITGSVLRVRGESFITESSCVSPSVALVGSVGGGYSVEAELDAEVQTANELNASVTQNTVATLGGSGVFSGNLRVRFVAISGGTIFEAMYPVSFELSSSLIPSISVVGQSEAYLNDLVMLQGSGFLQGAEGTTEVVVSGTLTRGDGTTVTASAVRVGAQLVSVEDRTRVTFPWTPRIGGIAPGRFVGNVTPWNMHANGGPALSGPTVDIVMEQPDTVLFGVDPAEVCLGQITDVQGRGFIGSPSSAPDDAEGTLTLRLVGQFWPCSGIPIRCSPDPQPVNNEVVGYWESGTLIRYAVTVSNAGGYLHAVDFSAPRGRFEGTVTPTLNLGSERRDGIPLNDAVLTLGPIRQICFVRFLPGFSDSLDLFGLGAVEAEIKSRILSRMQEIYQPPDRYENHINVEFRTEEPEDFYPGGYAILEIGGPDPNNLGLFGYDNTPGKDIQNLRLWDHVGGENATGALDGYGYGGVFIESMLFWSEHPPFSERPRGAPPSNPIFDNIFDHVRDNEVVAGEYPNGASPERVAQIEAAISFLTSMIADTAAHEFGHSLGLAQPFVPDGAYHNAVPQEGCLMDSGGDRPLEERARLGGASGARFCQENLWYLTDILPMD